MALIDFMLNLINYAINKVLILLRLKPPLNSGTINMHFINIRYGKQNQTFVLNLTPDIRVEDVKKQLKDRIGVDLWSDVVIIFSGKELPNDLRLSDCDFGQNSVIHAINGLKIKTKTKLMTFCETNVSQKLTNLDINDTTDETRLEMRERNAFLNSSAVETRSEQKSYFFVFCNSCKDLMNGKLRVICNECKNGTIVVNRDPKEWDDVLIPGRISGVCQSEDCNGTGVRFYFKCASNDHNSSEEQNYDNCRAVVLYLIRHNTIAIPCLACTDVKNIVLVFPCASKHVICLDCFKDYCISRLNERSFITDEEIGYTLNCAVGCPQSLVRETHHFKLMGQTAYDKYQRFGAEECVLSAGGVLCPQPGCGAGILLDPNESDVCNRITCNCCGFVFCRKCLQGYHVNDCLFGGTDSAFSAPNTSAFTSVDTTNADQSKWDEMMTMSTIRLSTKPCPKCRTPIERDGGCMHIVCTRSQCGFNWCWICQTEWNRECMANHWFG